MDGEQKELYPVAKKSAAGDTQVMLFEITKASSGFAVAPKGLAMQPPSSIGLLERDIEGWLPNNPNLLLPNEQLLVIARSVAGQTMADVLGLDVLGRLLIVEIKRDWSDRTTVGQLLEYAARLRTTSFDELQGYARGFRNDQAFDLYSAFVNGGTISGRGGGAKAGQLGEIADMQRGPIGPLCMSAAKIFRGLCGGDFAGLGINAWFV